jgi:hypothetical protein
MVTERQRQRFINTQRVRKRLIHVERQTEV